MLYDEADIRIFGHTLIDFVVNGQKVTMDRRTALNNKMFESAMKGKVSMQRFLYKEFERNAERLAAARAHYDRLVIDWIVDNPEFGKPDYDMPLEVEVEIESLREMLNYYFPDQYPPVACQRTMTAILSSLLVLSSIASCAKICATGMCRLDNPGLTCPRFGDVRLKRTGAGIP